MMNVTQLLEQTGAVDSISRELNVDRSTAEAGASALLPSILSAFQNPVAAGEGEGASAFPNLGSLGALLGTVSGLGGAGLLDNVTSTEATDVGKGNQILGQLFGSKDGSRAVAASASATSGVEPSLLKKMLPILAMVAAGYVMKQAGQSGGLGGIFGGSRPDAETGTTGQAQPDATSGILGELIGAAGKFLAR